MAIESGASIYNAISNTPGVSWGSLATDAQKVKDFFRNRRTQRAMDEQKDALGDALAKSEYSKAAQIATKAGDFERADNYAALANDLEKQKSNAAYQNALVGLKIADARDAARNKANKDAEDAKAAETSRHAAEQALLDLQALADSGDITKWNNETGGVNMFGQGGKNIGKRQAALAALLPYTNFAAKKSGGSGINTLGEMMAYLGIPENATSTQIAGALPGVARKLGMSHVLLDPNAFAGQSSPVPPDDVDELEKLYNAI